MNNRPLACSTCEIEASMGNSVPSLRTEQLEDLAIYCGAVFIDKNKGGKLENINEGFATLKTGEKIRIDTRTGKYMERA